MCSHFVPLLQKILDVLQVRGVLYGTSSKAVRGPSWGVWAQHSQQEQTQGTQDGIELRQTDGQTNRQTVSTADKYESSNQERMSTALALCRQATGLKEG